MAWVQVLPAALCEIADGMQSSKRCKKLRKVKPEGEAGRPFCFRKIARKYCPFISQQFEKQGYMNYQHGDCFLRLLPFHEAHFRFEPHPAPILECLNVGWADVLRPCPDSHYQGVRLGISTIGLISLVGWTNYPRTPHECRPFNIKFIMRKALFRGRCGRADQLGIGLMF